VYGSDHGPWYLEVDKRTYRVLLLLTVNRDHDRTWSVGRTVASDAGSRSSRSLAKTTPGKHRHFLHNADSKGLGRAAVRSICLDDGMRECGGIQELIRGERSASNHADENEQWQQPGSTPKGTAKITRNQVRVSRQALAKEADAKPVQNKQAATLRLSPDPPIGEAIAA